ncbi:MAG: hypothetical protein ABL982_12055 [Vicinamibacterales bacterium]
MSDAIKCFFTTDMDAMFIGGFALTRGTEVEARLRAFVAQQSSRRG